jgi:hypothetical protein
MPEMTRLPEVRSEDEGAPFRTTIRFRAANGAMIAVAVDLPVAADESGRALMIAREAIAQVAAAQSDEAPSRLQYTVGRDDCGAAYWSWATPEGWRRPGT